MNKTLLVLTMLFSGLFSFSQESKMSIISEVKKGSIRLKWFPSNYTQLQTIFTNGYTLDRIELTENQTPELADYSTAKSFIFTSQKANIIVDSLSEENSAVLEPLLDKNEIASQTGKDFAFALFSLQNVLSADLGELVGLTYTDNDFDSKKTYGYRVTIKGLPFLYVATKASELTRYPEISAKLTLDKKKTIDIEWNAPEYTQFGFGYLLEKSLDKPTSGNFMTDQPIAPVKTNTEKEGKLDSYRDENLTQGKYHYYRLTGLNYFGEPAFYSPWEKIYVPYLVNAEVYIDSVYKNDRTRVIAGTAISTDEKKLNIDKYLLEKSLFRDKGFEKVEEVKFTDNSFTFIVPMPLTGDQFYYKVTAISQDKDSVSSMPEYFFTLDQEPPGPVTMKSGKADLNGSVELVWTPSVDTDIKGYRIFRANALDEEFQEVNKELSPASAYIDKIRLDNLTSEVFYFVRAVDKNFNNSINSDTLLVTKPDTIAPITPYLYKPTAFDSIIELTWTQSPSVDIKSNSLIRISPNKIDTLYTWDDASENYIDNKVRPGIHYSYQIITKDKSNNGSVGELRKIYFEPGYRTPLKTVLAKVDRQNKSIMLTWEAPVEDVFSYQIYKETKEGKFTLIKTLESPQRLQYIDRNISIGNQYKYYLKYITTTGIHSLPSKKNSVIY